MENVAKDEGGSDSESSGDELEKENRAEKDSELTREQMANQISLLQNKIKSMEEQRSQPGS
ncbi:hypothetical protein NPN14_23900, partial [Vibrio parahaemolyticus]|uniref:hypothetical protein n=1 Tax=Vibrio parahaemolyticus TaxID=670 RepID=UPI00211342C6